MNLRRVRILRDTIGIPGPVVYWMSRDQRVADNWALIYTQELALRQKAAMAVVFCLVPQFLGAGENYYRFMLRGLQETEKNLQKKNIPFFLLGGSPDHEISRFIKQYRVGTLVTDFNPLRIKQGWNIAVAHKIDIPFHEVDAHNIVPCRIASTKQEYGAYTLRPKIYRLLPEFLDKFSPIKKHPFLWECQVNTVDWNVYMNSFMAIDTGQHISWFEPGEKAAGKVLRKFLENKILQYETSRNDPSKDAQSHLSPYLHFGQISAQRVTLEVLALSGRSSSGNAFLEELIVRRELSDNFCFYNPHYDNFQGLPNWAKETLNKHRHDKRAHLYTHQQLEHAETYDELWNAAQSEMTKKGKMHGYLRMYWAKKILEWTRSPEEAMEIAIYLNDRYELDGRDPNGYAGIAWSIGGVHDRPWKERNIFGKIRYMSYNGCKSKFNIQSYIQSVKRW